MDLNVIIDMAAEVMPERVAVVSGDRQVTYAELRVWANRVASTLADRGVDRLVLVSENTPYIPALVFGAARAGVPFTAVNYRLTDDKLTSALVRCAPALLVADERTRPRVEGVPGIEIVDAEELVATGRTNAEGDPDLLAPAPDGVAIALFTSGTTGEPKSVLLRQRNLASYVVSTVDFMSADEEDVALVSVPPYHIAGMAAVLSNTYAGRRLVYLPSFDPAVWVETVARHGVTQAMIVPTMLSRILDHLDTTGTELPRLRQLSSGGGRMPLPVIRRALERLPHVDFVNAYGLTETSSTIALLGPDDHRLAFRSANPDIAARLGSVGRPVPGIELQIRDAAGHPLPAGVKGEIVVRGDQVSGEYASSDAKDAEGWFRTNDTGWLDHDGYLFVEGRADDVIVRGGENMSPGEIEDVLRQHTAVADAAVIGVPDEEWGEVVAAFVVLKDGEHVSASELRSFVAERLRSSRAPGAVAFCPDLPYSETGKLMRRELRRSTATLQPI